MAKALALISGGLDSLLAVRLVQEQHIEVEGINFFTGFTGDHDYQYNCDRNGEWGARQVAQQLAIPLHRVNLVQEFKPLLLQPHYGYGRNLNPCLDCKLFMIVQARQWMVKHQFDFLITGEVVGQRPKSQRSDTMPLATRLTDNLIVRPLSAKLLSPTIPEQKGWLRRELLGAINGRSRHEQLKLAKRYGFSSIPQPGGGCLLTDHRFCHRLQDLLSQDLTRSSYNLANILLLRVGRHLRITPSLKVIVGRDRTENQFIAEHGQNHWLFQIKDYPGALLLMDGEDQQANMIFVASLAAYFSQARNSSTALRVTATKDGRVQTIDTLPYSPSEIANNWYL